MTTYFISRHPGAIQWAKRNNIQVDRQLRHLEPELIQAGDCIIGTLPVNLIAAICEQGGRYYHLTLDLPPQQRGRELSAEQMQRYHARLEEYVAHAVARSECSGEDKHANDNQQTPKR